MDAWLVPRVVLPLHDRLSGRPLWAEVARLRDLQCASSATTAVTWRPVMPLINYDLGDRAVAGDRCPCGRGLPTLRRLEGRAIEPDASGKRPVVKSLPAVPSS